MISDAKIAEIAVRLGIELWIRDEPNHSVCHGLVGSWPPPGIGLGRYDDPELRLISFFHEIGHLLADPGEDWRITDKSSDTAKWENERLAWARGLWLAEREGIRFSAVALRWADEQLASYLGM